MKPSANKFIEFISKPAVLGCLIFLASFLVRWVALTQTPYGNGWDSYFYLVQLKSILTEGKMHSPEWTLFYPLLLVCNIFSPDQVISVKILSCLLAGTFSFLVYCYALKYCIKKEAALLFASITLFSPELTYFTAQWPKNLLGVDLLLALLLAMAHNRKIWIVLLVVLGLFGHRMTAVLGIGCVAFWLINKHISPKVWLAAGAGLITLLLITLISPGIINLKDYQRIQNLIATTPQFSVASFISTFGWDRISTLWLSELFIVSLLTLTLLAKESSLIIKKVQSDGLMIAMLMLVLWFPFFFWEISGAAYRFFHVGALMTPLILLFLLKSFPYREILNLTTAIVLCGLSLISWKSYNPQKQDPSYALYDQVTKAVVSNVNGQPPELIIAHKSLAEYFTYAIGIDAMPWIPDYKIDSTKLWRIAVLPYPQLFVYYVNSSPVRLKSNYYFIKEDQWQQFVKSLKQNESADLLKAHLTWQNPNEVRPAFLRKN
ncbi:hypothetical protein WSM22_47650 [Cytophagales bacterium WSM2-2]|nr:hypothetical protein WSM22_47650 [Cytophagales bacterium WSM2-2]